MRSFLDAKNRKWNVVIDVTAVKRVRGRLTIDLLSLVTKGLEPLGELLADPCKLCDVLYVLLEKDVEAAGLTDEDFGRGLGGDALEHAAEALVEELVDFFPDARRRAAIRALLAKGKQTAGIMKDRMEREVAAIDPERLASTLMNSAGQSPESSELTPDPSHSRS